MEGMSSESPSGWEGDDEAEQDFVLFTESSLGMEYCRCLHVHIETYKLREKLTTNIPEEKNSSLE